MNKSKLAFSIPVGAALLFVVFAVIARIEPDFQNSASRQAQKIDTKKSLHPAILNDLSPSFGSQNAKVTVVEFLDFQCPYCAAAHTGLMEAMNMYRNAPVRFVFRQMPVLSIHPYSMQAANAALCAHEQKQYLAMQNILFTRQKEITPEAFSGFASKIGLNLSAFNSCTDEKKYQSIIQKDLSDAAALGITGTPTWFINGERSVGALSKDDLSFIIDKYLEE